MTPEERRTKREAQIAKDRQVQRDYVEELNSRVYNEPVDTAWRRATQQHIEGVFPRGLGASFSVAEVTCASTLCRVQPSHRKFENDHSSGYANCPPCAVRSARWSFSTNGATTVYLLRREATDAIAGG